MTRLLHLKIRLLHLISPLAPFADRQRRLRPILVLDRPQMAACGCHAGVTTVENARLRSRSDVGVPLYHGRLTLKQATD